MTKDKGIELLSATVVYNKYAKYNTALQRRETWEEIVDRYVAMMVKKYPKLENAILENASYIYDKKVLMSMRAAQFSGAAVEKNETRGYNCSFMPMDHYKAFSETMFLLLSGCGVGYSVQARHISQLPAIKKPTDKKKFLIGDSIEGWADAVKALMKAYMGITKYRPKFDYSDIREKGARLVTAGGKAPGPDPLRISLTKIESILYNKEDGTQLTDFEVHLINCIIADAVLAGGIRRAAMISLFDKDSKEMLTCKFGTWWEKYPELGRSNNSAVVIRDEITKEEFTELWTAIEASGSGEPGLSLTDNPDWGFNPCHEIALRPNTFCNLTEINAGTIESDTDFYARCRVASFFGTLQAGFIDFHYLRPIWRKNSVEDSLIGVGITGICNGNILDLYEKDSFLLKNGAKVVAVQNEIVSKRIGIPVAARQTTIKPSGTTSCVLGTSSGIHAWHNKKFIRNIQCAVGDDLYTFMSNHHPELITIMDYDPKTAVVGIPLNAPENGVIRDNETAIQMLDRVKLFNEEWVHSGHVRGDNMNNVSATVSIRDHEWKPVGEWMWNNRNSYSGISVLPHDGGTYRNAPFEEVSDEVFNRKVDYINNNEIDLTMIIEEIDNTTQSDSAACAGGACEIV
jgi:ribonucleoside-diphosphate reductase alpha chain|tara:strand:+ start:59 stop:1942 length:1884 start_codon:yes stop_codon:yes gene_type:complete